MPAHLLSAVMPTHNRPERLERAARSILDQRGAEVELLVVDDASSDHTPEVSDRLAVDPRVRVIRNDESLGPGGSRNLGIAIARGDLLGFCDDDDTWLPGTATAILDHMEDDGEVGVMTSWHQVVHDQSGHTATYRGPLAYDAEQLLWFNFVALPFGVIRRAMFPDDLAVDVTLPPCEDWDLWVRCAQIRPIRTIPMVLYAYHQHGDNRVTSAQTAHVLGRQRFLEKHGSSMSAACRVYHELAMAQLAGGRRAALERFTAGYRTPVASALAGSVIAASAITSDLGMRRHDPGLSARTMSRLLSRTAINKRRGSSQ